MSKRNSQEAKRAARERLKIERERQAKKDRLRRQLLAVGGVVAVLAIGGGIALGVSKMDDDDTSGDGKDWAAAAKAKLVEPANTSGKNGTTVVVGGADAKTAIDTYEDMRCPACAGFEQALGEKLKQGAKDGKYKLTVHLGAIIDQNMTGTGSRNAISALGAALNVSPEAFAEYHGLLYSTEHHPEESQDKFAENAYLLKVAENVKELKGNSAFKTAVEKGTYDKWALEMVDSFNDAGIKGTPTVRIDGKDIKTEELPAKLAELGVK
ncbi:thioredoxin domain-containing protein [Streptomyces polyrhachis]|uniref:Thioredoxin domain-containing protein n=1 Tax=Streptomyces polyrhachis TaxID=1282885 RepID=A0ABW2GAW2_9ACTN